VCPGSGKINVVFMTSAPLAGAGVDAVTVPSAWPDNATLGLSSTHLDPTHPRSPLNFTGAVPTRVPLLTPSAYWPSFLFASSGGLSVVYEDAVDDAAQTPGVYCSS
jgi:hypothetical protein